MKQLYPERAEEPQNVANQEMRIIMRYLRRERVDRAGCLSEESRVALLRDLRTYRKAQSDIQTAQPKTGFRAFFGKMKRRVADFLS